MGKLSENFGAMVFNDAVMHEKLPKDIYRSLKQTISEGKGPGHHLSQRRGECHEGLGD